MQITLHPQIPALQLVADEFRRVAGKQQGDELITVDRIAASLIVANAGGSCS